VRILPNSGPPPEKGRRRRAGERVSAAGTGKVTLEAVHYLEGLRADLGGTEVWVQGGQWASAAPGWTRTSALVAAHFPERTAFMAL